MMEAWEEMEINLYAMLLGCGAYSEDSHDVMDQECEEYVEYINMDTVTGAMREQGDW
jgi:hypothetical protein